MYEWPLEAPVVSKFDAGLSWLQRWISAKGSFHIAKFEYLYLLWETVRTGKTYGPLMGNIWDPSPDT